MSDLSLDQLLEEKPFLPTTEQQAILNEALSSDKSLMLTAMAGCSKSTTIELLARVLPSKPSLYVVFNKKNQLEAQKKFALPSGSLSKFGSAINVQVMTANGLGHGAWSRAIGKRLTVNTRKIGDLVKKVIQEEKLRDVSSDDFVTIMRMVSIARHSGLVPKDWTRVKGLIEDDSDSWEQIGDALYLDPSEDHIFIARKVLVESIRQSYSGVIDFDDQIYMSALFGGVFPRFPVVYVDEAQDLSPLNHLQIKKSAADRLIVVGDPRQAIYAFRGADSSSMDSIRELRPEWIELPLSTTFRCPRAIVSRQQSHAPGFQAHPSNKAGEILTLSEWKIQDLLNGKPLAILCRNNAPLLACALRIIKQNIGCTILGGEIGRSLISLSKRIVPSESTHVDSAKVLIQDWAQKEISLAVANEKDSRVEIIRDKADCLLAVIEGSSAKTMTGVNQILSTMFSKENLQITLSTGHKAKGLEWRTVIHLDPWRVPSKFAKKVASEGNPVPLEQDMNLKYVIETRAQERLILANLEDLQ